MQPIVIALKLDGAKDVVRQIQPVIGSMNALQQAQNGVTRRGGGASAAGGARVPGQPSAPSLGFRPPTQRQPPSFQKRLTNFISSSRINVGSGGLSVGPVIGQVAKLLGSGLALPIGVAAVAVEAMAAAASHASETLRSFSNARYTSGGTPEEQAGLNTIGGTVGASPEEVAADARKATAGIASSPYAAGFWARHGIRGMKGPYDPLDSAKRFREMIDAARNDPDQDAAKRALRDIGLEKYQKFLKPNMSESAYRAAMKGVGAPGAGLEKGNNDYDVSKATAKEMIDRINENSFGIKLGKGLVDAFNAIMGHPTGQPIGGVPGMPKLGDPDEKLGNKIDDLTDALGKNTRAMESGTYGGGPNARGAVPAGLKYQMLDNAVRSDAIKLGAFNL